LWRGARHEKIKEDGEFRGFFDSSLSGFGAARGPLFCPEAKMAPVKIKRAPLRVRTAALEYFHDAAQ